MADRSEAPQADSPFWWFWERFTSAHAALYKLTRGRIGGSYRGCEMALVESVGRRSGKRRTHPLMCREHDGDLVIVASKGGIDSHPAWYLNLKARPETVAWWRGRKRRVRMRETTGAERERLWELMVEVWPAYAGYQRRTERRIPVMVLEPAG